MGRKVVGTEREFLEARRSLHIIREWLREPDLFKDASVRLGSLKKRFWKYVQKFSLDSAERCWIWKGALHPSGAGQLYFSAPRSGFQTKIKVTRLAYILFVGPLKGGLRSDRQSGTDSVGHCKRDVRCVRPSHLTKARAGYLAIPDTPEVYVQRELERRIRWRKETYVKRTEWIARQRARNEAVVKLRAEGIGPTEIVRRLKLHTKLVERILYSKRHCQELRNSLYPPILARLPRNNSLTNHLNRRGENARRVELARQIITLCGQGLRVREIVKRLHVRRELVGRVVYGKVWKGLERPAFPQLFIEGMKQKGGRWAKTWKP